jgi:hypothetical protein
MSAQVEPRWLSLEGIAGVEASSEEPDHRAGDPLSSPPRGRWVASMPGPQVLTIVFDPPQSIAGVHLIFRETARERTQEFTLTAASGTDGPTRHVVRQQFTFSPGGATEEREDYRVNLEEVARLELRIVPDIRGGSAVATVDEFRFSV